MIGMMMMTFILFFAFVVNTGMLVNAKINLQNGADLAAYAGAASQARLLNQISYLNYEMRRQYKKFLFRYYVMGNLAQKGFPRTGGGGTGTNPYLWSPTGNPPDNYQIPVVCMVFNSLDNFCQLVALPKISIPTPSALDAIQTTLVGQLKQIEQIRQQNCINIGIVNTTALRLWLWNTDPDLTQLQGTPGDVNNALNTIKGLSHGLGLIPHEIILRQRILTLNDYVNEPPHKGVTFESIQGMQSDADPATKERTIEAFLSAFYTLGNHTFNAGDVVMDELSPPNLLQLKDIKTVFQAFAVDFVLRPGGGQPTQTAGTTDADCEPIVQPDIVKDEVTLGVVKDPTVLTYYAIKLKAKAKLMFSPFGDMELKAYAAAQPFGSRIGPPLDLAGSDFVRTGDPGGPIANLQLPGGNFNFNHKIPNLTIRENSDSSSTDKGWDTKEALGAFYGAFKDPSTSGNLPTLDSASLERAYQVAMAPNPYEANKYNIINDTGDQFVHHFDAGGNASFWAPVISPAKAAGGNAIVLDLVTKKMDDGKDPTLRASLVKEFDTYLGKLRKGQGENGDGFNIVRLQNPLNGIGTATVSLGETFTLTDTTKLRSSWNAVLNGEIRKTGRVGYSVKFVSFDSLTSTKQSSNGSESWANTMPGDTDDTDWPSIRH